MATIERAQPWLGTVVAIRADGVEDDALAHHAISAAFAEVATVHRLMSFHAPDSDVSRLNRDAARRCVPVDWRTREVLAMAQTMHRMSEGVFDIAIGGVLAHAGALPCPAPARVDLDATAASIALDDNGVRFHDALWIDLGGIAKGYAADRAAAVLQQHGVHQGRIDAGGDLRLLGAGPHRVYLDAGGDIGPMQAALDTGEGAIATSSNEAAIRARNPLPCGVHRHGRTKEHAAPGRTVSVLADQAMVADALTKVVMALGPSAGAVLALAGATAYLREKGTWASIRDAA
ncbi:FAD:protein FMN transferase [Luteibacter yeojuensis]|uniref:FAD:protein FMN transferase n=1 Tax=Luteibacter yeojuensis TaxID=345309 RepID=A0A0F3L010_9GAMM|nr:FAD:protein FMN transferase [Luteibacter yeojuensis]KJV35689.1 hypothetical protein VI08_06695 [Luteibacter yeojuensis]